MKLLKWTYIKIFPEKIHDLKMKKKLKKMT